MKAGLPRTPTAVGIVPVEIGVPVWDHLPVCGCDKTPLQQSQRQACKMVEFKGE